MREREVTEEGPLHDDQGRLAAPGFARRPVWRYEPERIRATPLRWLDRLRLKEWDFYATTTERLTFAVGVAHGGLAGVVFAQVARFGAPTLRERVLVTPFGRGVRLPRSSERGDVIVRRGGVEVALRVAGGRRALRVRWPRFEGADALDAALEVVDPPESIVVATPIPPRGFYYNRKHPCMPTTGVVTLGARALIAADERPLTTLDWGRGVWPYRTFWLWASGAGRLADGRLFGLNLGAGFGDLRHATENALFVDGRLDKLGAVAFAYDRADACAGPWRFRDAAGRLDLTLAPDRFVLRKRLEAGLLGSDLRQITGAFRGHVTTERGERIDLAGDRVLGWAEVHRARW